MALFRALWNWSSCPGVRWHVPLTLLGIRTVPIRAARRLDGFVSLVCSCLTLSNDPRRVSALPSATAGSGCHRMVSILPPRAPELSDGDAGIFWCALQGGSLASAEASALSQVSAQACVLHSHRVAT